MIRIRKSYLLLESDMALRAEHEHEPSPSAGSEPGALNGPKFWCSNEHEHEPSSRFV